MRSISYRELKRRYEADGPRATVKHLREAIEQKHLRPEDFSIRELAEATLGVDHVRAMDPRRGSVILEEGEAVDSTAFSNITGQIVYSKIMEAYQNEAFVMSRLVQTIPTRFNGEKIPGIEKLKDNTTEVKEGMPYPSFGFGEDYVETPATTKRGMIVPVTKEAIFFDRTNLILQRAAEVGEVLGLDKEKRLLDVALGITNNYKWKGTSYNTYVSTPWDNTLTDVLSDWTDVDAAEQLFADMLDPVTGEPILISATTLLVGPALQTTAKRIINATELRHGSNTDAVQVTWANPMTGYSLEVSRLAYRRLIASGVSASDAAKYWYFGDFGKAFAYMENWPITVTQAPQNSEAEFNQDIVTRYKASERGVAAVMNPRYVVQSTGAGS